MVVSSRVLGVCLIATGCGLERSWEAFQHASESADGTGSGDSTGGPQTDTDVDTSTSETSDTQGSGAAASTSESSNTASTTSGGTTGSGSTTEAASSTGAAGVCGDGVVDASEECDDGNTDETDRCSLDCLKIRLIFITSEYFQGDINGLVGADAQCRSAAAKAKMADPSSRFEDPFPFKALIATSTQTVFERHFHGAGPYQLVNGLRVSDSFDQLFSEIHANPINVDEHSETQHISPWTGMDVDGQSYPGIDFCKDWTNIQGTTTHGDADEVDGRWLYRKHANNPTPDCFNEFTLYCLEQE